MMKNNRMTKLFAKHVFVMVLVSCGLATTAFGMESRGKKRVRSEDAQAVATVPIVYSEKYEFSLPSIANLGAQYGFYLKPKSKSIYEKLKKMNLGKRYMFGVPDEYPGSFALAHDEEYRAQLQDSNLVVSSLYANIVSLLDKSGVKEQVPFNAETLRSLLPIICPISPDSVIKDFITPMMYQTYGTITACHLALKYQVAVSLGGGLHHACSKKMDGFCPYNDVAIAVREVLSRENDDFVILVVDCDVHQGNGYDKILKKEVMDDGRVVIFDVFNQNNKDQAVRKNIGYCFPCQDGLSSDDYLKIVKENLPSAIDDVAPDLIIYLAGADPFDGDKIGGFKVSGQAIIDRDNFIIEQARISAVPIAVVLAGGFMPEEAEIQAQSIGNIVKKCTKSSLKKRKVQEINE